MPEDSASGTVNLLKFLRILWETTLLHTAQSWANIEIRRQRRLQSQCILFENMHRFTRNSLVSQVIVPNTYFVLIDGANALNDENVVNVTTMLLQMIHNNIFVIDSSNSIMFVSCVYIWCTHGIKQPMKRHIKRIFYFWTHQQPHSCLFIRVRSKQMLFSSANTFYYATCFASFIPFSCRHFYCTRPHYFVTFNCTNAVHKQCTAHNI